MYSGGMEILSSREVLRRQILRGLFGVVGGWACECEEESLDLSPDIFGLKGRICIESSLSRPNCYLFHSPPFDCLGTYL